MTISRTVYNQLFEHSDSSAEHVIRLRPTEAKAGAVVMSSKHRIQMWTKEEHERFLEALEMYPSGPWKKVSDHIGTKTPRQTMTHAQKYRQKIYRRQRGLRNQKRTTEQKIAVSPSGVADLSKTNLGHDENANAAHSGFGLLDILAYSAAAAQSGQLSVATNGQPIESVPMVNSAYPQPPVGYAHPPTPVHITSPVAHPPSPQQSSPSRVCSNSHLPPLSQILQLRGSQVAQQ